MQEELQTSYYKAFICIIDAAVANYRPGQIGGEMILQYVMREVTEVGEGSVSMSVQSVVCAVSSGQVANPSAA